MAMRHTDPALRDQVVAATIITDTLRIFGGDVRAIHAAIARLEKTGYSRLEATKRVTAPLWARWRRASHRERCDADGG